MIFCSFPESGPELMGKAPSLPLLQALLGPGSSLLQLARAHCSFSPAGLGTRDTLLPWN